MSQVIAIDGPSGVGKSTTARLLAKKLQWTYLDTGAMYRCVTLAWLNEGKSQALIENGDWLENLQIDMFGERCFLDGCDVSEAIRSDEVTANASFVASKPLVRKCLTAIQRRLGNAQPCILDGRDIGTVVFPDASLKIFLTADPIVRARRRWLQKGGASSGLQIEEIAKRIEKRDQLDSQREIAPLKMADDAIELDTGDLNAEQVTEAILALWHRKQEGS